MYDRERELWKQSGARYQVKEEKRAKRKADTFESNRINENGNFFPIHLASLENTYGNVEFTRQEDGSLVVSFAKKQEFKEPVFERDEEKINENHLAKERTGSLIQMHNSGSPFGAEAFVLSKEKSVPKQVNQMMQKAAEPLDQMARSMASLLVPVSQEVMPREQFDIIYADLVRTARHVVLKGREKTEEEERMKKDEVQNRRPVKNRADGNEGGGSEEDAEENAIENAEESGKEESGAEENLVSLESQSKATEKAGKKNEKTETL